MSAAFDPAAWLRRFNAVGGYVVIGGKSFRVILDYDSTTRSQQDKALVMSRAFDVAETREIITTFLCDMTLSEFHAAQHHAVEDGQ